MPGMGDTLTNKVGPLPTWAWAGLATAGLGGYLLWRKKQSVAAQNAANNSNANSSNLGTVPISNLSTSAEPMPVSVGPTFVNVSLPGQTTPATGTTPTSGFGSNTWSSLNPFEQNVLAHTPVSGFTGLAWSKLTLAQKANIASHTPVPGTSGAAWAKLDASKQLQLWQAYDASHTNTASLKNPNGPVSKLAAQQPAAGNLAPAPAPAAPPPAVVPQTTS